MGIDKIDCFAYKNQTCTALTTDTCYGCRFYKTKARVRRGRKRAYARVFLLDEYQSDYIIDKYYKGKLEV